MNYESIVKGQPLIFGNLSIGLPEWTYCYSEVKGMSYRIIYVPTESEHGTQRGAGIRLLLLSGSFLLIFGFLTVKFWPEGEEVLERLLEAMKKPVTSAALESLANKLSLGEPVGEAVSAFCREVVSQGIGVGQ